MGNVFPMLVLNFALSLVLVWVLMPKLIAFLHKISYNQTVSEYSLQQYKEKAKTPTMGGTLFVVVPVVVTLVLFPSIWKDLPSLLVLAAYVGFGLIGFIDDFIIVVKKDNEGLKPWAKFLMQLLIAVGFYWFYKDFVSTDVVIPFINAVLPLGAFYVVFAFIMFTGESNAVNLTDGMDGLAAGCSLIAISPYVMFALQQNQVIIASFLLGIMGALIGYLRYNLHPAKIFMGDAGSLALGGVLAAVAMVLKMELSLLIIGGVFLWETICVVIQQVAVRVFKRRVFKYTPIHYSFVISGMKEPKVVQMFWMLSVVCAALGFLMGVL
ncbi:MAG: phospho-N-acetylmuramoyl-pentapeptide-transferase [Erysipelotrichaceae bacterium]|nr:phospho-N-acetylmuramoyl-pentapeptide-transferase [Erysipelotrichaceae bacterium]